MWWQVPLILHPPGLIYESAFIGSWIILRWQAGRHAKLTGACLHRFVSNAQEVFMLEKFYYFFVKLHFFSLKVKFVGENTNYLGGRAYLSSWFSRWGLPTGTVRTVWPWRWRHYVSKYLPVCTAWRRTENVFSIAARVLFVGHLFLYVFTYVCLKPPYNFPVHL